MLITSSFIVTNCVNQSDPITIAESPSVTIAEEDKFCESDNECTFFQISCNDCDCGTPINRIHLEKYRSLKNELCENYDYEGKIQRLCDLDCGQREFKCIQNSCAIVNKWCQISCALTQKS